MARLTAILCTHASAGASGFHRFQAWKACTKASWTQSSAAPGSARMAARVRYTRGYAVRYRRSKSSLEPGWYASASRSPIGVTSGITGKATPPGAFFRGLEFGRAYRLDPGPGGKQATGD